MDRKEYEAASVLTSQLVAANIDEFLEAVGRAMSEYDRDLISMTEAMWQVRQLQATLASSNSKLRELLAEGEEPPSGPGNRSLPWKPI
jgi:hypothetical protein